MKFTFTILFLLFSYLSNAQELSFCNWYNDKKGAVVLTFDDWLEGHEKIVVPALIDKKLVGTFFITANNTQWRKTSFPTMRLAFKYGSEIANHTLTHPDLTSIPFEEAKKEIDETRKLILDSIPGAKSLTFAYPMGTKNQALIDYLKKDYIGARSVSHAVENNLNYDFTSSDNDYFKINTVRVWRVLSTRKVGDWLNYTKQGGGLVTFMIHSIYNEQIQAGWDGMKAAYLNELLDTVKVYQSDLWVTTLEKAIQYHAEKKATSIEVLKTDRKKIVFEMKTRLNANQYFQELTLNIQLDRQGIKKIKLNGKFIPFVQCSDHLLINVNPNQVKNTIRFYY